VNIIAYIFSIGILFGPAEEPQDSTWFTYNTEAPVLMLNFYLMGKDEIDQEVILQIGDNIDYLNEEFEGVVKFELNKLFLDQKHEYLPDVHMAYRQKSKQMVHDLVDGIEEQGAINVYLLDTYAQGPHNKALMGFTPILSRMHHAYEANSPRFDRMFMAYPGLGEKTTLVHEMGHFLGLSHPWEMNSHNLELMGLVDDDTLHRNHMTYSLDVDSFTDEQLNRMQDFAIRFRGYLLKVL